MIVKERKPEVFIRRRDNCRGCSSKDLVEVLDLGDMPLAGGFLERKEDSIKEVKIPLRVHFCGTCSLAQILDVVDPDILFKKEQYISSVIRSLSEHFKNYANFLRSSYLKKPGSKLLDFGCNDGVLLQYFKEEKDVEVYGIDPAENVVEMAREKGLKVILGYFNQANTKEIEKKYGKMDVVTGSNVFAHTDDVHEILKAARSLLKPNGVFVVEVHYLKDLIEGFQYDTIYHEHLCYYSVRSLKHILGLEDLKIIDVQPLAMHGGAIRVTASLEDSSYHPSESVSEFLKEELKIIDVRAMLKLGKEAALHKQRLIGVLDKIKDQEKSIVGYGAAGRGTTLLNYCGIGGKYLDFIVDVSPLRAGKIMPGVHIPIYFPEEARSNPPDYFLVLAWNYVDSILEQEKALKAEGVKFIIPLPKIEVV